MSGAIHSLAQGLAALNLPLSEAAQQKLLAYAALMAKWNKVFNLTALRDPQQILTHHLLDSLSLVPHVPAGEFAILDVGSGAGLPGIPLAIARPELQVFLLDSNSKKTAFQKQAAIELGLPNVHAVGERVEAWQVKDQFPYITSRAFSDLPLFVRLTRHLLAPGGQWLAMKGQHPAEEMTGLPEDVQVKATVPLQVPGLAAERHLIVMQEQAHANLSNH